MPFPRHVLLCLTVWRDGQKKRCYLYRMLCAGSIEEKVFERQLSKEGLAGVATNEQARPPFLHATAMKSAPEPILLISPFCVAQIEAANISRDELRDLFTLHDEMPSHLHYKLMSEVKAKAETECVVVDDDDDDDDDNDEGAPKKKPKLADSNEVEKPQEGWPKETGDMHLWRHHLVRSLGVALRVVLFLQDCLACFEPSLHAKCRDAGLRDSRRCCAARRGPSDG